MSTAHSGDRQGTALRKKRNGRYFTEGNPFRHPAFMEWASAARLRDRVVLEPFAGRNSIIDHLVGMDLCRAYKSYDIEPANASVEHRDTMESFPEGYQACVTNPPWLARNIATCKGIPFPEGAHDNLYQFALEQCLGHCAWVAALVPESFIRANVFRDRLVSFVSVTRCLFSDTAHPVGMALFGPAHTTQTHVWSGPHPIGTLDELQALYPRPREDGVRVVFNEPAGNVGLIALDNHEGPSIRFCDVEELATYTVKRSGRHITKLRVDGKVRIHEWNEFLTQIRKSTRDVFLTCYKGIRKDGMYRRRLDWKLARGIIHNA